MNLYKRNFIGMKKECLNNILKSTSKEDLVKNLKNVDLQISNIFFFTFLAFIFVIFTVLVINFSIIFAYISEKIFYKIKNNLEKFILLTTSIPLLSFLIYLLKMLTSSEYDFSELAQNGCSDNLTLSHLNQYTDDMDTCMILI